MMRVTVLPRHTLFEKMLLGILFIIELPYLALCSLSRKYRERFSRIYLDN
jgi:hypothetical protein